MSIFWMTLQWKMHITFATTFKIYCSLEGFSGKAKNKKDKRRVAKRERKEKDKADFWVHIPHKFVVYVLVK